MRTQQAAPLLMVLLICAIGTSVMAAPLTLGESVAIALRENPEIKASEEKHRGAKYGVMESVGNFLPSVSLATTYSRAEGGRQFEFPVPTRVDTSTWEIKSDITVKTSFLEEKAHDTKLEIVQPVFQGGALWNQLGLARDEKRAASFELQAKRNEITLRVQEAYYGVLEAEKVLEAMEEAVSLAREHVRVAMALYKTGMTGRAETLRADVLLSSTLQDRLRAENGLTVARRAFNSLLNRDLDDEVSLVEAEELGPVDMTMEEGIDRAFAQNPDLKGFQGRVSASGRSMGLARSGFLPRLSLIFDYGWHEDKYRFDPDSDFWTVMGVASWDLFTSGRNLARYRQSRARHQQAKHELEAFCDGLKLQVTQAYLSLQEAKSRLDLAKRALASAEENYRVTEASYREGMATHVDQIDAQVTLTEARVSHTSTTYELYKAKAKLMNLIGVIPEFNRSVQEE